MTVSVRPNSIMQAAAFHGHERITIERIAMADVANIELLRRYEEEYRGLVDGEFGLATLPQNFARFARGELLKPVLALD
jgi:hypothetical protein